MRRSLLVAVTTAVLLLAVRATVAEPVRIASASMSPTLDQGDVALVTRIAPDVDDVRRGDVVVLRAPGRTHPALKRVVGLPGESVVVLDGRLVVDGVTVPEPYVDPATVTGYYSATFRVPLGSVLVLGDNRNNSVDSRDYGPVPGKALEGRLLTRLW